MRNPILEKVEPQFYNARICVSKNYRYEEACLLQNVDYRELHEITHQLDHSVENSHDVVSFWMVRMNYYCGKTMAERKTGIFRSTVFTSVKNENPGREMVETYADDTLTDDVKRVISSWNNMSGKYIPYSNVISSMTHALMKIDNYVHITSPIRRLVDLLNEMMFSKELLGITLSNDAEVFLAKWMDELEYINKTMRSIRKVQNDCELFHRCENDPSVLGEKHIGVFFDKIEKGDGSFTYMVYIEKLKLLTRVRTRVEVREKEKREIEMREEKERERRIEWLL